VSDISNVEYFESERDGSELIFKILEKREFEIINRFSFP